MYQPTIDSHLLTRQLHVQVPLGGPTAPDTSLAALGALALVARTRPSFSSRFLTTINRGGRPSAQSTRPTRVAAR